MEEVGQSVGQWVINSFRLEIAIASPGFASLFNLDKYISQVYCTPNADPLPPLPCHSWEPQELLQEPELQLDHLLLPPEYSPYPSKHNTFWNRANLWTNKDKSAVKLDISDLIVCQTFVAATEPVVDQRSLKKGIQNICSSTSKWGEIPGKT